MDFRWSFKSKTTFQIKCLGRVDYVSESANQALRFSISAVLNYIHT